ncbi:hypothetical protein EAF00_012000 [Botryotinia globosa]|nr:hypothetical protein EAF00_012000 [Botryotinia globosa]
MRLVCTGTPTSLKANYGLDLEIRQIATEDDEGYEEDDENNEDKMPKWNMKISTEATKKILELEELSGGIYSVIFPGFEQIFLNVTSSSLIDGIGNGDVVLGDQISRQETELEELNPGSVEGVTLEVGKQTKLFHQILVILKKRYLLARHSWMSYGITLVIPIVIAGALASSVAKFDSFDNCTHIIDVTVRNASIAESMSLGEGFDTYDALGLLETPNFYSAEDLADYTIFSIAGPPAAFDGEAQNTIYVENMGQYFGSPVFGVFADSADITLVHRMYPEFSMAGMKITTDRLANSSAQTGTARKVKTTYRKFRYVNFTPDPLSIPIFVFITLGFICSTSVSIMDLVFERINNVTVLQDSNSVSSAALWTAYLIFDMHIGLITSLVTWVIIFSGGNSQIWYESTFLLFVILLFCIATYLGLYLCSLFLRRAAFAVGLHIMLMVVYPVAYFIMDSKNPVNAFDIALDIKGVLGLTSPEANLLRTFFVATDNFGITCGETGWYDLHPIAFQLYGGIYIDLILQITFCSFVLRFIETGSSAWFLKLLPKRKMPATPAQLDFGIEGRESPKFAPTAEHDDGIPLKPLKGKISATVLVLSKITKFFKSLLAVQEISFNISTNETLALLGANGAGKTTTINMIRGLLGPDHGTITIDGIKVLASPQQARIHTGVCPQDDAIDELTVRQTLSFYASIKLSGGTRRKVMIAIAILGNPQLLLLDEPSTGQDAGAKRVLWKTLRSLSNDRAILITTHIMEETEALATKVVIVDKKILASGTTSQLRSRFGGFYRCAFGEVEFELPYERKMIGWIMLSMETLMVDKEGMPGIERRIDGEGVPGNGVRHVSKVLRNYTILEPSNVFLNVCKEAEIGIL